MCYLNHQQEIRRARATMDQQAIYLLLVSKKQSQNENKCGNASETLCPPHQFRAHHPYFCAPVYTSGHHKQVKIYCVSLIPS